MRNPDKDFTKLWPAIQSAYEAGESVGRLSLLHAVPRQSINRQARLGHWVRQPASKVPLPKVPIKVPQQTKAMFARLEAAAVRTTREALSVAVREGRQIGLNASAFVEHTILQTHRLLEGFDKLLFPVTAKSIKHIPAWVAVVKTGREAYRLDDQDPVQPIVRLDTVSQALDLVESSNGHWEQLEVPVPSVVECPVSTNHTLIQPPNT